MFFRHNLSRRDALLVLLGATSMHLWSLFHQGLSDHSVIAAYVAHTNAAEIPDQVPIAMDAESFRPLATALADTPVHIAPKNLLQKHKSVIQKQAQAHASTSFSATPLTLVGKLPHTSVVAHAPGWTIFRNLYMSNGTLFLLTPDRESFPEIRMMTSTGLEAVNSPENIAMREPTPDNMDFISPEDAEKMWGSVDEKEKRIWSIEGNTLLFNDPSQFLRHYYHFVAELFFGVQAFWHSAFSTPPSSPAAHFSLGHPSPPPLHRAIFAHSNADGWRDGPGFNAYFLRAAFPSLTVEHQEDWADRILATQAGTRAFHFPLVLLTDRSAAHRGEVCGMQTQRTAAEPWAWAKAKRQLMGMHVGGWWEPVRAAMWRFAGAEVDRSLYGAAAATTLPPSALAMEDVGVEAQKALGMPETIVVSYISRQESRRRLTPDSHMGLIAALEEMVARRKSQGEKWELAILQAEKMTKDEQVKAAARSTILLGVHGNGLTHLVFMQPTRASTVIEIFYPQGFAHDYHWTARALGMSHFAVWNDTHHSYPNKPDVNYPEGFQGSSIPVHGPTVAQLIEDRVDGKL